MKEMAKEIVPRVHPIPEHLEPYFLQADPAALENMEDEVYRLVMLDVDPKAIVEQIEEHGWDREFVTWLVNFTHAQRRPVRTISRAEYEHKRLRELGPGKSGYFNVVTWLCGFATLGFLMVATVFSFFWPGFTGFVVLILLMAFLAGYRFVVGLLD
jgi:hypothetical protein